MTGAVEVLVSVPNSQLHKVENNIQTLLTEGEFTVSVTNWQARPEEARVEAAVGQVAWALGKHLPALKAAHTIYSFALEHTRALYYCLILPVDTPSDVLEAVHDVLHDSCAFSTVKQVDAAAEEVDKLSGGKEAAMVQQAEAAVAQAAATNPSSEIATAAAVADSITAGKYTLPSSGNAAADKLAAGLLWSGTTIANAVGSAATSTSNAIQNYTNKQIARQQPNQKPAKVSPTFRKGLELAGKVAGSAAYVTGKLAALIGQASYAAALTIAKSLPGHKKKQPGELVSPEERSALHTVGAAGLIAFVDVYDSLEVAAKSVLGQSAEATSQYISYKYGPEAGTAAIQSVPVAMDMLQATINFSRLGARAFISKTAKQSAKMYFKSTVVGIHPDEQKQKKRPHFPLAQPPAGSNTGAAAPAVAQVVTGVPATADMVVGRVGSSSNYLSSPYPAGPAAVAAADGAQGGVQHAPLLVDKVLAQK